MNTIYFKFRIFLLMLAFGLASVSFFNKVYEKLTEISVNLPQVESNMPIYVIPFSPAEFESKDNTEQQIKLIQKRDLSTYDFGKTFSDCKVEFSEVKDCELQRIKARDFIFSHWKAKKRAYIIYVWTSCDNAGSYHIFIEPDKYGKWHIIERTYNNNHFEIKLEETIGYSLKYKRATDDNYPLKIGTYYLSVRNKNGEEVDGF